MSDFAESDDGLTQPETSYGSAKGFMRDFLIVTSRREVSPKGEFRWDPQ